MKRLQTIPCNSRNDLVYGFTDTYTGDIKVNVQYIWQKYKDVDKFIEVFTQVYDHEVIHLLIYDAIGKRKRTDFGEEYVVRRLLRERFSPSSKKFYELMEVSKC